MEDLATTQRLMFGLLALNLTTTKIDSHRMKTVLATAISSVTEQPQSADTGWESVDCEELRPLSELLAERVHHPKYGKNHPLATAEEVMAMTSPVNVPVDVPGNVPTDVQDGVMDAMAHELARHNAGVKIMTWNEWQETLALVKKLSKKCGVSPEEFFALDGASEMMIRAVIKKGDYRKQTLASYMAMLDKTIDSMLPAVLESTLIDLAGSGSSSYRTMNDSIPALREAMQPMRQYAQEALEYLVESDVERIYGKTEQ